MKRRDAGWFFACVGFLNACGSAAAYDYTSAKHERPDDGTDTSPALLTIRAYFVESLPSAIERKYALIWFPESHGTGAIQAPANVRANDEGGALSIDITQGPPIGISGTNPYDRAELVVYQDGAYQNGTLDISSDSPDRILARADGVYFGSGAYFDRLHRVGDAGSEADGATSPDAMSEGARASASRFLAGASNDETRCGNDDDKSPIWTRPICIGTRPGSSTTDVAENVPIPISRSEEKLLLRSYLCPGFWGTSAANGAGFENDPCRAHQ